MGQRPARPPRQTVLQTGFLAAIVSLLAWAGCDRKAAPGAAAPGQRQDSASATDGTGENGGAGNPVAAPATAARSSAPRNPTVASLSPAATDLLVGMGAADHLVAVSNYDPEREPIGGLPRVGDYRTQDWEKLAAVRPRKMIIQLHPDRTPAGLRDRAKGLGIELVNVQIDDLDDVFEAIPLLAAAVDERHKGDAALK